MKPDEYLGLMGALFLILAQTAPHHLLGVLYSFVAGVAFTAALLFFFRIR